MWVWTLNWGEIRDDIVVGTCPTTAADIDAIGDETGARALLSLQTDECRASLGIVYEDLVRHARRRDLVLVNAPMRDFDAVEQRSSLPSAVTALRNLLAGGRKTYVHCTAGANRAPLTVLAYLTFVEGMTVPDAMALIHNGRPGAEPYWESYHGCRQDVIARNRATVERRAWELCQLDPNPAPDANWRQAEIEVLSESFGAQDQAEALSLGRSAGRTP